MRTITARLERGKRRWRGFVGAVLGVAILASASTAGAAPLSQGQAQTYRDAFAAATAGQWDEAKRLAARSKDPVLADLIRWLDLGRADGKASFEEISAFLATHPDWPGLIALRQRAEKAMPASTPPSKVVEWFRINPAITADGVIRHAAALVATGAEGAAADLIRRTWAERNFAEAEERTLLARFGQFLRPAEHAARLDRLIWEERLESARRLLPLVSADFRALAEARIKLASSGTGVDAAVRAVPASLRQDPGLNYERLRWRRKHNMDDGAVELLLAQPDIVPHPDKWWTERHILARRAIERKDWRTAYKLVAAHGQTSGTGFAQAEWLAGWLALRRLDDARTAFAHFDRLYRGVSTPLSLSRGAYWAGRAAEALGEHAVARQWYEAAGAHSTTFYGQLAILRLSSDGTLSLAPDPEPSQSAITDFESKPRAQIARRLAQIGQRDRAALFVRKLAGEAVSAEDHLLVARLAEATDRPDIGIAVAKQTTQDFRILAEAGYPLLGFRGVATKPEQALVHGLIRQESVFDSGAVSSAGARGLMQLMPATAEEVARKLGVKHSRAMLHEPHHNVRLGSKYLADVLDRFGGSYVLAIAGYNAGPARVSGWLTIFGDPRGRDVDEVVDWIELIPIYETRNYVQRVLENVQVYRARLSEASAAPIALHQDLMRGGKADPNAAVR